MMLKKKIHVDIYETDDCYLLHTQNNAPPNSISLVAQRVKRLPSMQETQVRSLGREDPLEKEMATHSSILAWAIPWTEKPGRLQSMGPQRVGKDWATWLHFFFLTEAEDIKKM